MNACCKACGVVVPELEHQALVIADLERELRVKRRQLSEARGQRNERRQLSPFADLAQAIFDLWNRVCRNGRAKEFGAARFDPVVDRLTAGATLEDDFSVAITGARNVLDGTTKFRPDNPTSYTDLSNIAKDAPTLERFKSYAEAPKSNVVQLRPAPDHSGFPQLGVWLEGRILGDCPHCGQAGRVTPKRDGLGLFECFGRCGEGSGVYRLVGHDAPMVAALNGGAA